MCKAKRSDADVSGFPYASFAMDDLAGAEGKVTPEEWDGCSQGGRGYVSGCEEG